MYKSILVKLLVTSLLLAGLCGSGVAWLFYPFSTPINPPSVYLVPKEAFTQDWEGTRFTEHRVTDLFLLAASGAIQWFDHPNNTKYREGGYAEAASHTVASFRSVTFAHLDYLRLSSQWFQEQNPLTEWDIPADYQSTIADEYQVGCAVLPLFHGQDNEVCVIVARYGQYVSEFWVLKEIAEMTDEELITILEEIDANFR